MYYHPLLRFTSIVGAHIYGLTYLERVAHICVSRLTIIIGPDNSLSPGRCQAITSINAVIMLIQILGTIFNGISNEIHTFSLKKTAFENFWVMAATLPRP